MALHHNPRIVTDGLILYLDPADVNSYPGTGATWTDLTSQIGYTNGTSLTYSEDNKGTFTMSQDGAGTGAVGGTTLTDSTDCTCVFWIKTTDTQALFWGSDPPGHGGSYYLGAFRGGNKEYYSNCGSPDYYQDLVEKSNIYDNIRDGEWHMVEFKNVDFSNWTDQHNFNCYSTYQFNNGSIGQILIYNRLLSPLESAQNYNATKTRYGL